MSVALREIFAHFGITTDDRKLKQLDTSVMGMVGSLRSLGAALTGGAVMYGLRQLVGAASDVDESMNVVGETFKEATDDVLRWAGETGPAIGRSSETLKQYAGELGALLVPMIGSREEAARLSTTLSGLAVDLGSFFNRTDDDALTALRSAISGQTEPMLRFGVNLTQAALNAFALEKGLKQITATTKPAEKAQLIYAKIMADTADKQGDAARTADGFANSEKGALETLKDLRIEMGGYLLGPATMFVQWLRRATDGMIKLSKETKIFQTVFVGLAAAVVAWGVKMAAANVHILAFAAGLAIVALAAEDIYQTLSDPTAQTALGDFLDLFIDREKAFQAFHAGATLVIDGLRGIAAAAQDAVSGVLIVADAYAGFAGLLEGQSAAQAFTPLRQRWQRQSALGGLTDEIGRRIVSEDQRRPRPGAPPPLPVQIRDPILNPMAPPVHAGSLLGPGPVTPLHAGVGASPGPRIEQTTNLNITVPPGTSREQTQHLRREIGTVIDERNRAAATALREQGQ